MNRLSREIAFAIEVFVRGHSAGRSRTFPYEVSRVGPLWQMRDAPRKNPRNYRKEEWIAHDEPEQPTRLLGDDAPFRQYVALDGADIVGRVRSVDAAGATWCADMYVQPSHRRRGIGQALLSKMLRDDRARGSKCSVLTASHTGALLYPRVGYERIGTLFMFAPKREGAH
jgi:GNAT superfamily N-acetyltransferase